MVQEAITLGHKISVRGIKVDMAKIDVKGVRNFLLP